MTIDIRSNPKLRTTSSLEFWRCHINIRCIVFSDGATIPAPRNPALLCWPTHIWGPTTSCTRIHKRNRCILHCHRICDWRRYVEMYCKKKSQLHSMHSHASGFYLYIIYGRSAAIYSCSKLFRQINFVCLIYSFIFKVVNIIYACQLNFYSV